MRSVNIHQAKADLSRLIEEAARSDLSVIVKASRPLVKVVPLGHEESAGVPRLGFLQDADRRVPDDFDTMDQEEIICLFDGEEWSGCRSTPTS